MTSNFEPGNPLSTIYVGGISDDIEKELLYAAFIPFGDIIEIHLPPSANKNAKHRGIAYIEYEEAEDAQAAIENMHLSELNQNILRVNLARITSAATLEQLKDEEDAELVQEFVQQQQEREKEMAILKQEEENALSFKERVDKLRSGE